MWCFMFRCGYGKLDRCLCAGATCRYEPSLKSIGSCRDWRSFVVKRRFTCYISSCDEFRTTESTPVRRISLDG
jgi:hypothetical protein